MDTLELATLAYFRDGERYLNGQIIDWKDADYRVMWFVAALRRELDAPITLIRGNHGWQGTAVDWCCPGVSYKKVAMAVMRLPELSWGLYSGASVHMDRRPHTDLPARWLAVKAAERGVLQDEGLEDLITAEKDGWLYLVWRHEKSLDALALVVALAEGKRRLSEDV